MCDCKYTTHCTSVLKLIESLTNVGISLNLKGDSMRDWVDKRELGVKQDELKRMEEGKAEKVRQDKPAKKQTR